MRHFRLGLKMGSALDQPFEGQHAAFGLRRHFARGGRTFRRRGEFDDERAAVAPAGSVNTRAAAAIQPTPLRFIGLPG